VREKDGILEGRTIVLELDEERQVVVELEGEEEVDALYLEHFRMTHWVDLMLSEGEVQEGESWSLEGEALSRFADLDETPTYFEEEDEDGDDELDELLREFAEVDVIVAFDAIEEHEGQRCGRLEIEGSLVLKDLEVDPDLLGIDPDSLGIGDLEGVDLTARIQHDLTLEGTAWISLEERRPVELRVGIRGPMSMSAILDNDEVEVRFVFEAEVEITHQITWTLVDKD